MELTNQSNSSDPSIFKSAFILNDGSIVDLDGSSLPSIIGAYANSFVRIAHRNHLSVRTMTAVNTQSPQPIDLRSNLSDAYFNNTAPFNGNQAMRQISTGVYGLWAGNTNGDAIVQYNTGGINDRVKILQKVGVTTTIPTGLDYHIEDTNLDGFVQYNTGGVNDRVVVLQTVGTTTTVPIYQH